MDEIARTRKAKEIIERRVKAIKEERGVELTQYDIAAEAGVADRDKPLYEGERARREIRGSDEVPQVVGDLAE
jgi:hypothetical protein